MGRLDLASPSHRTLRDPPMELIITPCRPQFKARSKSRHPRPVASRGVVNLCIQTRPLITPLSTVQSAIESKSFILSLLHSLFELPPSSAWWDASDPGIMFRRGYPPIPPDVHTIFLPSFESRIYRSDLSLLYFLFIGKLLSPVRSRLASCA